MFNEQSVDYLSDSVAEQSSHQPQPQPQPQQVVQAQSPQVNHSVNMEEVYENNWQDYSHRANVAPYSTHYTAPKPLYRHEIDVLGSTDTTSSFKTGLLLSSLLLVGSVTGYSLEKQIQKKSPKGYGAILGSLGAIGLYYVASKTLSSGIMEGVKATGGFIIPMLPIFVSMYQGKQLDKKTAMISAGVGTIASGYVLVTNFMK